MTGRDGKAVLYLSPWGRVTGSLVDSLEYLIALKLAGVHCRLVYLGRNPALPEQLVKDRYELDFDPLEDAVFPDKRWHLGRYRFEKVLLPYTTYRRVYWWLRSGESFVLPTMWMRRDARRPFGWPVFMRKPVFLLDPDRHGHAFRNVMDYRKRLLLDCLKRPDRSEPGLLANCLSPHKRHAPGAIRQAARSCGWNGPLKVLAGGKAARAYRGAGFEVLEPPVPYLFSRYTDYLYIPALDGYDENPRLLIESAWLGKRIHFSGGPDADPVSWRKYRQLLEDPGSFRLTEGDPVVERFL